MAAVKYRIYTAGNPMKTSTVTFIHVYITRVFLPRARDIIISEEESCCFSIIRCTRVRTSDIRLCDLFIATAGKITYTLELVLKERTVYELMV